MIYNKLFTLKMKTRSFVLAILALLSLNAIGQQKKNFLFIMTDQQRYDALSLAGNTVLETPNLDRLASQGVYFENAYSAYYWLIQSYPGSLFAIKAREGIEELNINEDDFQPVIISGIYDESLLNGTYRLGDKAEQRPGEGGEEGEAVQAAVEGYAVQLGSFSEEKNAENFIDVLKERGFSAYSITAVIENGTVFRVRVGAVASLKEAEEMKKTLEDMGYQGFIVKEK